MKIREIMLAEPLTRGFKLKLSIAPNTLISAIIAYGVLCSSSVLADANLLSHKSKNTPNIEQQSYFLKHTKSQPKSIKVSFDDDSHNDDDSGDMGSQTKTIDCNLTIDDRAELQAAIDEQSSPGVYRYKLIRIKGICEIDGPSLSNPIIINRDNLTLKGVGSSSDESSGHAQQAVLRGLEGPLCLLDGPPVPINCNEGEPGCVCNEVPESVPLRGFFNQDGIFSFRNEGIIISGTDVDTNNITIKNIKFELFSDAIKSGNTILHRTTTCDDVILSQTIGRPQDVRIHHNTFANNAGGIIVIGEAANYSIKKNHFSPFQGTLSVNLADGLGCKTPQGPGGLFAGSSQNMVLKNNLFESTSFTSTVVGVGVHDFKVLSNRFVPLSEDCFDCAALEAFFGNEAVIKDNLIEGYFVGIAAGDNGGTTLIEKNTLRNGAGLALNTGFNQNLHLNNNMVDNFEQGLAMIIDEPSVHYNNTFKNTLLAINLEGFEQQFLNTTFENNGVDIIFDNLFSFGIGFDFIYANPMDYLPSSGNIITVKGPATIETLYTAQPEPFFNGIQRQIDGSIFVIDYVPEPVVFPPAPAPCLSVDPSTCTSTNSVTVVGGGNDSNSND